MCAVEPQPALFTRAFNWMETWWQQPNIQAHSPFDIVGLSLFSLRPARGRGPSSVSRSLASAVGSLSARGEIIQFAGSAPDARLLDSSRARLLALFHLLGWNEARAQRKGKLKIVKKDAAKGDVIPLHLRIVMVSEHVRRVASQEHRVAPDGHGEASASGILILTVVAVAFLPTTLEAGESGTVKAAHTPECWLCIFSISRQLNASALSHSIKSPASQPGQRLGGGAT